jgi:hypothetical protein
MTSIPRKLTLPRGRPTAPRAGEDALTPTGTLIPNSGRGGRWVGPLLSEAAEALRYVGAGHTRGKVVVTV